MHPTVLLAITLFSCSAVVVYESTVYPGATEEVAVPILERCSGMKWKRDFHVAYSPERINPGDKDHTLARITKVVAADDAETLEKVAALVAPSARGAVNPRPTPHLTPHTPVVR